MKSVLSLAVVALLTPLSVFAAPHETDGSLFLAGRTVLVATSSDAVYAAGGSVTVTSAVNGDLSVAAGSLVVTAPIAGDALLSGGSVSVRGPVGGDVRAFGARVTLVGDVDGDVVVFAATADIAAHGAQHMLIAGGNVSVTGGADGPVTIYGNHVLLSGAFLGDVTVMAGGRVTLAEDASVQGDFTYESPERARIASSAIIAGETHYTGPSYLPSSEQAHALILAGFGVFLFIRFLAGMILAGLAAGLFPGLTRTVVAYARAASLRSRLLTFMLGFAILVATPVLVFFLALSFVGMGLALLAATLYLLLGIGAYAYAGVLVGALIARLAFKRSELYWHDGALGMLALSVIALLPGVGGILFAVLVAFAEGLLATLLFHAAFPKSSDTSLV